MKLVPVCAHFPACRVLPCKLRACFQRALVSFSPGIHGCWAGDQRPGLFCFSWQTVCVSPGTMSGLRELCPTCSTEGGFCALHAASPASDRAGGGPSELPSTCLCRLRTSSTALPSAYDRRAGCPHSASRPIRRGRQLLHFPAELARSKAFRFSFWRILIASENLQARFIPDWPAHFWSFS